MLAACTQRVKLWGGLEALLASKLPPGPLPPGSPRALAKAAAAEAPPPLPIAAVPSAAEACGGGAWGPAAAAAAAVMRQQDVLVGRSGSDAAAADLECLQRLEATIARVHQVRGEEGHQVCGRDGAPGKTTNVEVRQGCVKKFTSLQV